MRYFLLCKKINLNIQTLWVIDLIKMLIYYNKTFTTMLLCVKMSNPIMFSVP